MNTLSFQPTSRTKICQKCHGIDFRSAFNLENVDKQGQVLIDLSHLARIEALPQCPICQFLRQMISASAVDEEKDVKIELRAYNHVSTTFSYDSKLEQSIETKRYLGNYLQIQKEADRRRPGVVLILSPISGRRHRSSPPCLGRFISPLFTEFDLVSKWTNHCIDNHPDCSVSATRFPQNLQVIDCKAAVVTILPANEVYFALSYVIGKPTSEKLQTDDYDGNGGFQSFCPVVRDAMTVVNKLHGRYLWVDRYSIAQHDPTRMASEILRMHDIYEQAYTTIIPLTEDSFSSIPGISRPRSSPTQINIGCGILTSASPDDLKELLEASTWNTRGWTYQEGCLSPRCILFTEREVFLTCSKRTLREGEVSFEGRYEIERFLTASDSIFVKPTRAEFGQDLLNYVWRNLTYDKDILDGYRGILGRFPQCSYWGIPVLHSEECSMGGAIPRSQKCDCDNLRLELSWEKGFADNER